MDRKSPESLHDINVRDADEDDPGELMAGMPHGNEIGMRLHRSAAGKSLLSVPYDDRLIGDPDSGVLHGGVITALLDTASGSAVMSMPHNLKSIATLDLRIDYMRPATPGETVFARAECYRMTRSIGFTRAFAYHTNPDDPIATAAGAFMVQQKKAKSS
ncbi:MAG: PaaI family thioesterase [Pseudomonadota bacterium]